MNANSLWAHIFIDELAKGGICTVAIAPGSRSTPLTLAFASHPGINVFSILDERGAAFFALGASLYQGSPAAVLCTSGTAAANLFPAAMEANLARVPLILITADRPHDVRTSGANQSADQVKLFGSHVRWSEDVVPPQDQPHQRTVRYLRTLAARAISQTLGPVPGPVHLNFPFRKPLEPSKAASSMTPEMHDPTTHHRHDPAFTTVQRGLAQIPNFQLKPLVSLIERTRRGLIICGPRSPGGGFPSAVISLAQVTGYPIFADALSGVRFCEAEPGARRHVIGGYETFLSTYDPRPELILRFGGPPVSPRLDNFLATTVATQVLITSHTVWEDPHHQISQWIYSDEELLCIELSKQCSTSSHTYLTELLTEETRAWNKHSELHEKTFFEGSVLIELVASLPNLSNLVVGNSLPIRHLDEYVAPQEKTLSIYCNRGASGIDGTIATAAGVSASSNARTVVVLGDISLYHDLNSLLIFQRCNVFGTILVINNNGGRIFERLPIAHIDPPFTDLFLTPHGMRFKDAAAMFGLDYTEVTCLSSLKEALDAESHAHSANLIEVVIDEFVDQDPDQQLQIEDTS